MSGWGEVSGRQFFKSDDRGSSKLASAGTQTARF